MPSTGGRWLSFIIVSGVLVPGMIGPGCGGDDDNKKVPQQDAGRDAPRGGSGGAAGRGGSGGTGGMAGSGGMAGVGGSAGVSGSSGSGGTVGDAGNDVWVDAGNDVSADAASDVAGETGDGAVSCVGDDVDSTPPTIVSAALINNTEVRITFSEAVRPPAGVDPTKFRLSIAVRYSAEGPLWTRYEDLSRYTTDSVVPFSELRGACTTELTAVLAGGGAGITAVCQRLAALQGFGDQIGLYLHFTQAGTPTVADRAGNPLADVAEHWLAPVDGSLLMRETVRADFPDSPVRVTVDCGGDGGTG